MKHILAAALFAATPVSAAPPDLIVEGVVRDHILPGYAHLAEATQTLSQTAQDHCAPDAPPLRAAFGAAFDAWIAVSHLRFGPSETHDRAFALAFWPDPRAATPKALSRLIAAQDPIAGDAERFAQASIATRGFYALEFLLYDATVTEMDRAAYRCQLVQSVTADIAKTAGDIHADWRDVYAFVLTEPSQTGPYRSDTEALKELFKALSTGLQFTSEARLGRPLGTFQRPRPNRAEARRAARSARHVALAMASGRDLAGRLATHDPQIAQQLDAGFARTHALLAALDDPTFASVSDAQGRLKVEVLQQSVDQVRAIVRDQLGPRLGVAAGFNALDGD